MPAIRNLGAGTVSTAHEGRTRNGAGLRGSTGLLHQLSTNVDGTRIGTTLGNFYWGDKSAAPPMRVDKRAVAAIGFLLVRDLLSAGSDFSQRLSQVLFSAANAEIKREAFREKAVQELEALVSGNYWEVDSEEGLYVASIDEIELEDDDEEEDEELD